MIAKTFEVRDSGTFIPVLAIKLCNDNEGDRYLLSRAGYGSSPSEQSKYVQLVRINGGDGHSSCDPYKWGPMSRTMQIAHKYILENFDTLEPGAVVDVEFILGETQTIKKSERFYDY